MGVRFFDYKFQIALLFLLCALLLAACSSEGPVEDSQRVDITAGSQKAAFETNTQPSADALTESPEEPLADECISCHTDKDRLIQTSDPVEAVESESSGEG